MYYLHGFHESAFLKVRNVYKVTNCYDILDMTSKFLEVYFYHSNKNLTFTQHTLTRIYYVLDTVSVLGKWLWTN